MYEDIKYLSMGLPDDILKRKYAGDIEGALRAIERRLLLNPPEALTNRLLVERDVLNRLPGRYPVSRVAALAQAKAKIAGFTEDEFDELELDGWMDFQYVNGEKKYLRSCVATLIHTHADLARRSGVPFQPSDELLDSTIAELQTSGRIGYEITMRASLRVEDAVFIPNEIYRVHLPFPRPCEQISNVRLIAASDNVLLSAEAHPQRTAYFEAMLHENRPFWIEYAFDSDIVYADPTGPAPDGPLYTHFAPPNADDLAEQPPHIRFTPFLRELAAEIAGTERAPAKLAMRIYDYVTKRIRYSFMRNYFLIPDIAEYCALSQKGDCGVQSLLFIALSRILGIPARWQSGLTATPAEAGCHDWAQFYLDGFGWLFCDCSFGGSAHSKGNDERRQFYFGNLDPFRMAANARYQCEFDPPRRFLRDDPFDSQSGECETASRGFSGQELDSDIRVLSARKKA